MSWNGLKQRLYEVYVSVDRKDRSTSTIVISREIWDLILQDQIDEMESEARRLGTYGGDPRFVELQGYYSKEAERVRQLQDEAGCKIFGWPIQVRDDVDPAYINVIHEGVTR